METFMMMLRTNDISDDTLVTLIVLAIVLGAGVFFFILGDTKQRKD